MMRKRLVNQYYPYGESYIVYPLETFDFIPDQLGKAVGELLDIEADEQRAKNYSPSRFWASGTVDCAPGEVYGVIPLIYLGYTPPPADLADGLDDSDIVDW